MSTPLLPRTGETTRSPLAPPVPRGSVPRGPAAVPTIATGAPTLVIAGPVAALEHRCPPTAAAAGGGLLPDAVAEGRAAVTPVLEPVCAVRSLRGAGPADLLSPTCEPALRAARHDDARPPGRA